jgi:hypothetical protein
MAIRQVLGLFACGGLIWGFFVWLISSKWRSAGDVLAGTVVLHNQGGVLELSRRSAKRLVRSPYVSSDSALLFSIEVSILSRMENNPSWRCPPFCAGT